MRYLPLLLMLSAPLHAEVKTSSYQPGWTTLPTPPALLFHSHLGSNPQQEAIYEWAYSLVDEQGKISLMSPAVTVVGPMNYTVSVTLPEGIYTRAVGYILWSRRVGGSSDLGPAGSGELEWRPNGVNRMEQPQPFLPISGWTDHSLRARHIQPAVRWYYGSFSEKYEDTVAYPRSTILTQPTAPPRIQVHYLQNRDYEFCYTWVGNQGETAPSPVLSVQKTSSIPEFNNPIVLIKPDCPPQGALGFYLYMRVTGSNVWHRQPRRHMNSNSYLWGAAQYKLQIDRCVETCIQPSTGTCRSWLSSLQKAIEASNESIIIDTPQTICCPVIMPFKSGMSQRRTISTATGSAWKLETKTTAGQNNQVTGFPIDWPMWIETSQYTRLVACQMISFHAECGIDFLSYDGSTCFHFRAERVGIKLWRSLMSEEYTAAIRQLYSIEGAHTCSEPVFIDCDLWARHCIVCEGNQSANWECRTLNAVSPGGLDSSILSINNSGSFVVSGRLTTDGARNCIVAANVRQIDIAQWYTDRGFPCWVSYCTSNTKSIINIKVNQVNHWPSASGTAGEWAWLHVAEAAQAGSGIMQLNVKGTAANHQNINADGTPMSGNGPVSTIFCPRYGGIHYQLPVNSLLSQFHLYELSKDWWSNNGTEFYDPVQGMVWRTYRQQWDNHTDAALPIKQEFSRAVVGAP